MEYITESASLRITCGQHEWVPSPPRPYFSSCPSNFACPRSFSLWFPVRVPAVSLAYPLTYLKINTQAKRG